MQLPHIKPRDPYRKRVLSVALSALTIWHKVGGVQLEALVLSLVEFGMNVLGMIVVLAVPFTFWLAPLYLWLIERAARRKAAAAAELHSFMQMADDIAKGKR